MFANCSFFIERCATVAKELKLFIIMASWSETSVTADGPRTRPKRESDIIKSVEKEFNVEIVLRKQNANAAFAVFVLEHRFNIHVKPPEGEFKNINTVFQLEETNYTPLGKTIGSNWGDMHLYKTEPTECKIYIRGKFLLQRKTEIVVGFVKTDDRQMVPVHVHVPKLKEGSSPENSDIHGQVWMVNL